MAFVVSLHFFIRFEPYGNSGYVSALVIVFPLAAVRFSQWSFFFLFNLYKFNSLQPVRFSILLNYDYYHHPNPINILGFKKIKLNKEKLLLSLISGCPHQPISH
jgi:hypothetical protein